MGILKMQYPSSAVIGGTGSSAQADSVLPEVGKMNKLLRLSKIRCIGALISAAVVAVCVSIGVTMNLTTLYDENFDHMGLRTFCMFTVNSNILCALGMLMALPYTIDGLRKKNLRLPRWMINILFAGVTSVALTFVISLCVLAPVKGFVLIFTGSRFFLHGLCPILAILAFCFMMTCHVITLKDSLFALLPVLIYAMVYYFMVEILGPKNGGWNDFYGFFTKIPSWISLVAFLPLTFSIAAVLRFLHNRAFLLLRKRAAALYAGECGKEDAEKQITYIANLQTVDKNQGIIVVPVYFLDAMIRNSGSKLSLQEAGSLFLNTALKHAEEQNVLLRNPM